LEAILAFHGISAAFRAIGNVGRTPDFAVATLESAPRFGRSWDRVSRRSVPFFTTKPHGSGIGLVLSRQIAEAHQGTLELVDRGRPHGCHAILRLPLS
jgi:hypothetical protein